MASVAILDPAGQVAGTLELEPAVFEARVSAPLVHQAVVRELAGHRAGTHDTKGRSEVSGGGRKPWRQKGTGRARQGSIRAPQWRGGGTVFGPTPRSYAQAMPRRARRAALRAALTDALRTGRLRVVEQLQVAEPRTRACLEALRHLGLGPVPTLLVVAERREALDRASRNVPWLRVVEPGQVTVTAVLRHRQILCEREAVLRLQEWLSP